MGKSTISMAILIAMLNYRRVMMLIMVIQGTHWWFIEPIDDDFGDDLWKSICHMNL